MAIGRGVNPRSPSLPDRGSRPLAGAVEHSSDANVSREAPLRLQWRMQRAPLRILACSDAVDLADTIASHLGTTRTASREVWFACGEAKHVIDENIRGADVYVIQRAIVPGSSRTVYDRFVAALHAVDGARCADADRVTVLMPYFPGSRQDKRKGHVREGVSTGLFARMLSTAGASMVITVEPHNEAMIGCFRPSETVYEPVWNTGLLTRYFEEAGLVPDVVASTDVGGLEMARRFAQRLHSGLVALSKERDYSQTSTVINSTVIGDPRGKSVLIIDDIVDTAGSVCSAVRSLWAEGATDMVIAAPHMLLSGPAWERLHALKADADARGVGLRLVGTSAIHHPGSPDWYSSVPIEPLLADVIRRVNTRGSVRDLERP